MGDVGTGQTTRGAVPLELVTRPALAPQTTLGRYAVLEEIGRGGMGRVFRAYDAQLQREVALKELRRGALDSELRPRLVAEARAMAKLAHPNVVSVYGVESFGSHDEHLVLVMEYVDGRTLSEWLERQLEWRDIVSRFIQAGLGLAAAHDVGLLHRDFKPANVLVADDGRVKVTDFGIAKDVGDQRETAIDSEVGPLVVGAHTQLTEAGTVLGTPPFMSPEQHAGAVLTPATDQFSFCVSLWRALCGDYPYPYRGSELAKRKLEGPPAWPVPGVPRRLVDAIRRGLAVAPEDRWPTMSGLVEALRETTHRRGRTGSALVAASAVVVVGVGFGAFGSNDPDERCTGAGAAIASSWDDARKAETQEVLTQSGGGYANRVAADTIDALDAFAGSWAQMHTDACLATAVRGEQSTSVMDARMACLDESKRDFDAIIAELRVGDESVLSRAYLMVDALPSLDRCADLEQLQAGKLQPRPEDAGRVEQARAYLSRATAASAAGHFETARAASEDALEVIEGVDFDGIRAEVLLAVGNGKAAAAELDEAQNALQNALQSATAAGHREAMASIVERLVVLHSERRKDPAAARLYLPLAKGFAETTEARAKVLHREALILGHEGRHADAEATLRRSVRLWGESDSPVDLARAQSALGNALTHLGRMDEAEASHRAAVDVLRDALGPDHPEVASALNNWAVSTAETGDMERAVEIIQEALEVRLNAYGDDHPKPASTRINLSMMLRSLGRPDEAVVEARAALQTMEASLPSDHFDIAAALDALGAGLARQGRLDEALKATERGLTIKLQKLDEDHSSVASTRVNLGSIYFDLGRYDEAAEQYRRAVSAMTGRLDPKHPSLRAAERGLERARERQSSARAGD